MRVRGRHRLVFLLLASTPGCGVPAPDETPTRSIGRLDRATYDDRLAAAAGGPLSADRLAAAATTAAARIQRRMDELAESMGEPAGWQPLFARLRREGPADEAAVLDAYRTELSRVAEFTRRRELVSLPDTEPEVLALENRSLRAYFPLALYHGGRFAVTVAPAGDDDPDYLGNHCGVCIAPLAVHEGYPGHHVAFARMADTDGRAPSVAELARYKPFVEGWGLYAEALMLEQGYYQGPAQRLAAWRMILLRLTRAEVDAGLHGGGLESAAAEEIYRRRLLLTPAAAAAELRTHLAKPTVKASYFLGLLQILELRERVRRSEPETDPRGFHDRLLGPPGPIPRIARERFGVELGTPGEADLPWPWSPAG